MKIVIIGSGNVASVLGRLIKIAGHDIVQVVSRTAENAEIPMEIASTTRTVRVRSCQKSRITFCQYADIDRPPVLLSWLRSKSRE